MESAAVPELCTHSLRAPGVAFSANAARSTDSRAGLGFARIPGAGAGGVADGGRRVRDGWRLLTNTDPRTRGMHGIFAW
jgi:hypothetical protein